MVLSLGLSATLLINIPFLGNVDLLGMLRRAHRKPAVADSLPPAWRNASRLALENQLVFAELPPLAAGGAKLKLNQDPRTLQVALQPDSGMVITAPKFGAVDLGQGVGQPLTAYSATLTQRNFERFWNQQSLSRINNLGETTAQQTAQTPGSGLSWQLPSPLPRQVQSILGPGGPAINVRGSENIRISGTSNWTNQQVGPLGQKKSLFPTLDMQQDLDIQLEGQLSDRVRINLLQNSANQIPLSNRIAINYRGDEDALFQQIDLGNTNLSLPGTQYVSYSGKNEGLFGAKASSRVGPLDWTILASKQEGRSERASYAGGASKQTQTIRDLEYVRGVYFFLNDPNEGPYEIPEASIRVFRDDFTSSNDVNVVNGWALVNPADLAVAASAESAQVLGKPPVSIHGRFDLLDPGPDHDYEILSDVYGTSWKILRLTQPLTSSQRLAVTYRRRPVGEDGLGVGEFEQVGDFTTQDANGDSALVMKLIRVPPDLIARTSPGLDAVFDSSAALFPLRELELRNYYQLAGQRIDPGTFKITIRKGRDEPPVTVVQSGSVSIPYIEVLGLDSFDESQGTPLRGHDAKVDGTPAASTTRLFVDYENGSLFFLEPRPFAPRLGAGGKPWDRFVSLQLTRRDSLVGAPESGTEPNPAIYDRYTIQTDTDAQYFIEVEFTAARSAGEISLGRGNLLEGSEVVTINGQALQRGKDYDVDYDLGRLTLKRQLGPADQLNIDYSYAPLFLQAGRTLIGSAFSLQGRERSFGGAFIYESRGAQEQRPRLGEEPARSVIGDLNTDWTFRPGWMTRSVDLLPGVRTTAPSELRVQAEVGASFPNPNTRDEVFIDDMEGVRDAVSLSMDQSHFRWSSVPTRADVVVDGQAVAKRSMLEVEDQEQRYKNAEIRWYSPYAVVKERDLKPTLSDAQGAQNNRSALAISIPRRPLTANSEPTTLDTLWAGLTYPLDQVGLDLSKAQFIELWVNDFNDHHDPTTVSPRIRGRHALLHVDLGKVSEDEMRAPDARPDAQLNSEDRVPRDNQLDVTSGRNEDTGADGRDNDAERAFIVPVDGVYRDVSTSSSGDPEGDDFATPDDNFPEEIDARRYRSSIGQEGDKNVNPYPETEDRNLNGNLDRDENYFEYTIDLGDDQQPYLVTDLQQLRAAGTAGYESVAIDNGWRRYRIPIDDSLRVQFGVPDLSIAQHVRIWLERLTLPDMPADSTIVAGKSVERPLLLLGSVDIVGSRWRANALDTTEVNAGATQTLNSVNTVDNADVYFPPFDPGTTRSGSQSLTRREQSIALEFSHLRAGRSVEAFKTFSIDEDYSRYGRLAWYATGYSVRDSLGTITNDALYYFVRFASDEQGRNYYEYRAPLPTSPSPGGLAWQEVRLKLTELSNIKLDTRFPAGRETLFAIPRSAGSPETLIVKGRPSFTRLRRISFGLVNKQPTGYYDAGQLWFNELRAIEIFKDQGRAQRVQVGGRFANLFQYNFSWNGRDEDFLSVGETRGSGTATNSYTLTGSFDVHRFFEASGIVLPVTFNFSQNTSQPRYSAGDDIVRGGDDLKRSETFSDSRSWGVSYSRVWSERSNPFLRYTVGGVTASFSSQNAHGRYPAGADQSIAYSGSANYNIAPRKLMPLPVPGLGRTRLYLLPERFYVNYRFDQRQSSSADRRTGTDDLIPRDPISGRSGFINMGADTRPFEQLHHHIEAQRNLNLEYRPFGPGSVNVGQVTAWSQAADASYTPRYLPWLRPQFNWSGRYNQNNGPELSPDLSVRAITNGQQATVRWEVPFARFGAPSPGGSRDSLHTGRRLSLRRFLAWIGNINSELGINQSSAYSRLRGMPDILYLFGLSDDPGVYNPDNPQSEFRMTPAAGNRSTQAFGWRTSGRTTLALPAKASIQASGDFESRTTTSNGAERGQDQLRFPDLTFEFGNLPSVILLDKIIQNPRLRSAVNRQVTTEYNAGRDQKSGVTRLVQFRPLLGITGDLRAGTRLELSAGHRHSDREVLQLGSSLQQDINTDLNLGLSRSYTQGQKISFLGRESTVKSSVSFGLTGTYERQTGRILVDGIERNPVRRDRLSVNANGTYGFSSNVSGNATVGFSQDRDQLSEIVRRSLRLELSARFSL